MSETDRAEWLFEVATWNFQKYQTLRQHHLTQKPQLHCGQYPKEQHERHI